VNLSNARYVNGVGKSSQISVVDPYLSAKKKIKVRYGRWNVGTLTGRSRELAEVLRRGNVNVCGVQETKWKEEKARKTGEGYKIFYSEEKNARNDEGIILDKDMNGNVVEVFRNRDRVIAVKVMMEEKK